MEIRPRASMVSHMKRTPVPYFMLLAAVALTSLPPVHARIWADARSSQRTFEGDLVSLTTGFAGIKLTQGKVVQLPISSFSEPDKKFLTDPITKTLLEEAELKATELKVLGEKEAKEAKEAEEAKKQAAAPAGENAVAKALDGKLQKLEGDALKPYKAEAGKEPQFYLVYFSAKW